MDGRTVNEKVKNGWMGGLNVVEYFMNKCPTINIFLLFFVR